MTDTTLSDNLHRLMHVYRSQLRAEVAAQDLGLPITHIRALKGICRNPESTAHSIAQRMQRDKAQITRVLKELLGDGLIEKRPNPNDGRSQLLFPTIKGEAVLKEVLQAEQKTADAMTRSLSPQELDLFSELTGRMVEDFTRKSGGER